MTYLYDKIMYLIIVFTLFLISYLIFKKPKKNTILGIDDLEEPPVYKGIMSSILKLEEPPRYKEILSLDLIIDFLHLNTISSKKAELKRTFFLFIFISMIYFLFFSVLPGNERVMTFVCAADEETAEASLTPPKERTHLGEARRTPQATSQLRRTGLNPVAAGEHRNHDVMAVLRGTPGGGGGGHVRAELRWSLWRRSWM